MVNLIEFFADLLMLLHAGFSLFLVLGLVVSSAGIVLGWRWTRRRGFQVAHLLAVLILVFRVWMGLPCPLSAAENGFRSRTTEPCALGKNFHNALHWLAFRGADKHGFTLGTTLFGLIGIGAFLLNNHAAIRARTLVTWRHRSVTDL